MSALRPLLVVLAVVFSCGVLAGEDKAPVPDAAKQKEAEKLIKEVFKAEYAQTKPEDKAALANKLIQQAGDSKDDLAARYVLLREASALAVQAGDLAIALNALTEMGKVYIVDATALKLDALAKASSAATKPDAQKALAEHYLALMDEAAAADNYDAAMHVAVPAEAAARRGQNATLITRVRTRAKELRDLQGESAKAAVAKQTLAQKPDDPVANLLVGRFLCFSKADWDGGLLLLAKCSLPALKTLAARDVMQPTEAVAQVEVADGWWDLAEAEPAKQQKAAMQGRAKFWYEKALPSLTGLNKTKVEKRIAAAGDANTGTTASAGGTSPLRTMTLNLGGVGMEFVLVPAGEFMMGADDGAANEKPVHKVKIAQPFCIGKYDVTVAQFRAFAEAMKYQTEAEKCNKGWTMKDGTWQQVSGVNWKDPGFKQEANHPVVAVTWKDAQEFCKWATKLVGRTVRLPSEAEWEYAARGPSNPKYPWGDKWEVLANVADASLRRAGCNMQWGEIKEDDGHPFTSPGGAYKNASWCGAYDMAGNVSQWCQDCYSDKYYGESPAVDPHGPASGGERVLRGGGWPFVPDACRSAHRASHSPPWDRAAHDGFRVVIGGAGEKP